MIIREKIIERAREWIGTRFRYQGRIKKNENNRGGVDCLGLIFGVCDELNYKYNGNLLSKYDNVIYSKQPNYDILNERFSKFFKVIKTENINIGDIVLKEFSKNQFHLMFYTGKTFIHASVIAFSVIENSVDNLNNSIVYSMLDDKI